ncbi:MAG: hypothetical protein ABR954_10570 [Dehalococcoidales bacterium]
MSHQPTEEMWQQALKKWKAKSEGNIAEDRCGFCLAYIHIGTACPKCPLSMGLWKVPAGACWNPKHPWYAWKHKPTKQNALAVYKFILARYKKWKKALNA